MTRQEWAFTELDIRRQEDARFPVDPPYGHPDRPTFNRMKLQRAKRRKAMGYSRATANSLVAWAEEQDRRAA